MKKEDKIELTIAIVCGIASITIILLSIFCLPKEHVYEPVIAGLVSLFFTGCFFFTLSFSQRHTRNGDK